MRRARHRRPGPHPLTEGLRSDELLNLRVQDLDLPSGTLVVIPIKMDRNSTDARVIPLQPKTVRALTRYLRVREDHKRAKGPNGDGWLWLGTRNRSRLLYAGLHRVRTPSTLGVGRPSPTFHTHRASLRLTMLCQRREAHATRRNRAVRGARLYCSSARTATAKAATASARGIWSRRH
ncbi:site-specific integrase [Streptomyces sp. NPDC057020]|uniref:site-specific integrase n=1 Tax=unclassified Streptomyces TaxID=2593676 RepID=UPI003625905E